MQSPPMKMKNVPLAITAVLLTSFVVVSQTSDAALRSVKEKDRASRGKDGNLPTLSAQEHLDRGRALFNNRHFPEAREHFQKILDNYSTDTSVMPAALFLTGRSYYWEREYETAIKYLDRVTRDFPDTKDGREGLYFNASCTLRIGKNDDAARLWQQYTVMYPTGERIDGAYVNSIDALREAGKYDDADAWVEKTRQRFSGMPAELNALHARLRMEIFRRRWQEAVSAADTMLSIGKFYGAMTSSDEVKFLKAFALESAGRKQEAVNTYASIPNNFSSYFGGLASERLARIGAKFHVPPPVSAKQAADSQVAFRSEVLRHAKRTGVDPRFVLAIMKQESSFRPDAKSPAAARGLLQLTFDTALKYNLQAGRPNLTPDDLYNADTNIAIGCEYIGDLKNQFGGLYEAIAASYNGGEDNAARWLSRSEPKEPGIFASEVGFAETKDYVFKVMTNYRIYRALYDENLGRR